MDKGSIAPSKRIKKQFLLLICLCSSIHVTAQLKTEFSVYAGGGISTLLYGSKVPSSGFGLGGHAGVEYSLYLLPRLSLGIGIEFSTLNAKAELYNILDAYATNDGVDDFIFISSINNYKENVQISSLAIPLVAYFHFPTSKANEFILGLGGKVSIPLNSNTDISSEKAETKGYYPAYNLMLDMPKFQGFGTFENLKTISSPSFTTAFMIVAEAGMKWGLSNNWAIYTGIYINYGFNNTIGEIQNKRFISYNAENPADLYHNSMLLSQYCKNIEQSSVDHNLLDMNKPLDSEPIAGSVTPLAAGLKVKLTIGGFSSKKCVPCMRYDIEKRGTKKKKIKIH